MRTSANGDKSAVRMAHPTTQRAFVARLERSFIPGVIDAMLKIPDLASIAAIHYLEQALGRRCGGSTGTNFIGASVQEIAACAESGREFPWTLDQAGRSEIK